MKVEITEFALDSLAEIESFAILKGYSPDDAARFTDDLFIDSLKAIEENPERYPFCVRLADFGLQVRQRLDKSSHWCMYENKGETIYVLLFLHTKQDLISALYRHQIMRA